MAQQAAALSVRQWIRQHQTELTLFTAGCILRVVWLKALSLWYDETLTLIISRSSFRQILPLLRRMDTSPPLHYFLMHFWILLFPDPLLALRSFSVLCSIMSLGIFFFMCRRIVPENVTTAFFMGCFSSFWVHMAQDGRCYSFYLLVALLEIWIVFDLKDRWSKSLWVAYTALGVLGLYTHYYFSILLLTHFLYLSFQNIIEKKSWRPLFVSHSILFLLYLPWIPSLLAQGQVRSWRSSLPLYFHLGRLGEIFGPMTVDLSQFGLLIPNWIQGMGFLIVLILLGSFILLFRRTGFSAKGFRQAGQLQTAVFLLFHLSIPLCGAKAAELITGLPLIQSRYFLFFSPFVYWTFALALKRLSGLWSAVAGVAIEAVFVIGLCGYFASNLYSVNLTKISTAIRSGSDQNDALVYLDIFYYPSMRYYYLPERRHFLVSSGPMETISLNNLPGYQGIVCEKDLARLGRCVVFDPTLRFSDSALWMTTGRQLSDLLTKAPQ